MGRPDNVQDFVNKVAWQAQAVSKLTGLPASVIVAQAGLETSWGKKVVGNAYFGVKANAAFYECQAQVKFQTKEAQPELSGVHSFCAYQSFLDAAKGYADFIRNGPQFKQAIAVKDNPKQYAAAVADGGFGGGTDRAGREAYKDLLLKVMRDFGLEELDRTVYLEPVEIRASKP